VKTSPSGKREHRPASMSDKRITVVGLGHFGGGVGATRWLCSQGAKVTVSDKADASQLAESIESLGDLEVELHLGGHDERDFLGADLLVVSPAVPRDMPFLEAAQLAGVPRTTEINLFLERCGAPVVGITGSVGKSTTSAMAAAILAGKYHTHIGGNIGRSLLEELPDIAADHIVVLELSSFQLEELAPAQISPHVAVITNLMPNHLDRHGSFEAYADAKKNIYRFQSSDDVLILNAECSSTATWKDEAHGRVVFFGEQGEPFELSLPGRHNQANAQAAWAIAQQFDIARKTAAAALAEFVGLPHRLQFVTELDNRRYYNDSKCTTPQGAIVALNAFAPRSVVIIVGGYDKAVSFDELGSALARRAKAVVVMGATRGKIITAVEKHLRGDLPVIKRADDLPEAVTLAQKLAHPGEVILLSPACASYDMFANYEQRGKAFIEMVTARSETR